MGFVLPNLKFYVKCLVDNYLLICFFSLLPLYCLSFDPFGIFKHFHWQFFMNQ